VVLFLGSMMASGIDSLVCIDDSWFGSGVVNSGLVVTEVEVVGEEVNRLAGGTAGKGQRCSAILEEENLVGR
jgi:hypothetical protein